jgi:hypothetical protein
MKAQLENLSGGQYYGSYLKLALILEYYKNNIVLN